jgi:hypothetical protein
MLHFHIFHIEEIKMTTENFFKIIDLDSNGPSGIYMVMNTGLIFRPVTTRQEKMTMQASRQLAKCQH